MAVELAHDEMFHHHFLLRDLHDPLLDRPAAHQPEDDDGRQLAQPVGARERLDVVVRVPVGVVQDHRVRRRQVDALPARARREQEDKRLVVGAAPLQVGVEAVDAMLALRVGGRAVEALVAVALRHQVVLQNVEHLHHLRDDEHAVAAGAQLLEHPIEQLHLPARRHELLERALRRSGGALALALAGGGGGLAAEGGGGGVGVDEPRVVGALLELHEHVGERRLRLGLLAELLVVARQYQLVQALLGDGEVDAHH